jgi:hypothetical protein
MFAKDEVSEPKVGEKCHDMVVHNIFIDIPADNELVSYGDPFLEGRVEVLHESKAGVSVVILGMEVVLVLSSDGKFARVMA